MINNDNCDDHHDNEQAERMGCERINRGER